MRYRYRVTAIWRTGAGWAGTVYSRTHAEGLAAIYRKLGWKVTIRRRRELSA